MSPALAVTGSGGFVGWHLRVRARAKGLTEVAEVPLGPTASLEKVSKSLSGSQRLIHIAGVNRGDAHEVRQGNLTLARQLDQSLRQADIPPTVIVYANSVQTANGSPYGDSKAEAGDILASCAAAVGADFVDLRLPNLFGEHGRPHYNSVVATFAYQLASGGAPKVDVDGELALMHVQEAVDLLLHAAPGVECASRASRRTVSELLVTLAGFAEEYRDGGIPELIDEFDVALFNTYRSFTFPAQWPIRLLRNSDHRGYFVETVRARRSPGQTSFSATARGLTRGEHFHLNKIERFVVMSGQAEIALRRVLTDDVVRFRVRGDEPVIVDMPTMWAHNITNTGDDLLYTLFWTNELFDSLAPDTYQEDV